ncbi:hypothetical protein GCM10007276_16030 [Agaricicola taiwanensis]|uniref:DUF1134 domain-containing protein n=1 Tax=Agaricicola taiwanensis TaxID=591372 RepID=A0A8J2YEZ0_9RHOB|nr:DUF1134 domain-containing protein [Agaricicola taiwanensis]GGE39488.1 hypothetical protein GCM10007276_16030 [Agaricicola taiwanensis]
MHGTAKLFALIAAALITMAAPLSAQVIQAPSGAPGGNYQGQQPYGQQQQYAPPPAQPYGGSGQPESRQYGGQPAQSQQQGTYTIDEIVGEGHKFFGTVSRELGSLVERAFRQWGQPNGYILGQEGSGAFVAGLRYGEGTLYTRLFGQRHVYWQGPSVGWDFGGDGARTMILIYNLPSDQALFQRFPGIAGSAYLIGGFGMTALGGSNNMVLVPIRSGVGVRLGANVGYLKFTPEATWNPF